MAQRLTDILDQIPEHPFQPRPYYSKAGDSLFHYFENTRSYGDRIDGMLTVFRSMDDDRIIGFQLKGISELVKKLHSLQYRFEGDISLAFIFSQVVEHKADLRRADLYDRLRERTVDLAIAASELASAAVSQDGANC